MAQVEFADVLTNPESTFSIRTQNKEFNTEAFDSEEAALFEEQFNALIADFDSRMLTELFADRANIIAHAATHAKQEHDEKRFGGINASDNEIAFDVIRPGHILSSTNHDDENEWKFDPGSADWNDWIGDGTSSNDYTVDADQTILVLGFMDLDSMSEVSAINVDRFGRNVDMLPKDLHDARVTDNENDILVQALPTLVGTENDRVHIRLRHDVQTESEPRLLGINFGVGNYMNTEEFSN